MTRSDTRAASLQASFLDMLHDAFQQFGVRGGLPPQLRRVVAATPRHRFVHRYRVGDGPLCDSGADPAQSLPEIYSDAVMRHVNAAGAPLPSSNSQPSYILYLLHLLSLEPGQSVLEIGSGSGWLAAVMARLVGPQGRVIGIELIPGLARQSRADLAALKVENVAIISGDGTNGHEAGAPYDRAIITAATWDVPASLFDQVAEGGLILVPIEQRGGHGCSVTVLRRQGAALVAERAVPGWFVPLLGAGQDRADVSVEEPPEQDATARFALPLGVPGAFAPTAAAMQFRAFLGRTEPGFVTCAQSGEDDWRPDTPLPPFGIRDGAALALWRAGEIVSYGDRRAASSLARAYANWAALGLPGLSAFQVEIYRAEAAPPPTDRLWIERRGSTALAWRLRPEVGNWQALNATE